MSQSKGFTCSFIKVWIPYLILLTSVFCYLFWCFKPKTILIRCIPHQVNFPLQVLPTHELGCSISLVSPVVFFCFLSLTRRFWNHVLICFSVKFKVYASSIRLRRVTYWQIRNSLSSSRVWWEEKHGRLLIVGSEKEWRLSQYDEIMFVIIGFNIFMTEVLIIQKPAHWSALQIIWLVSTW